MNFALSLNIPPQKLYAWFGRFLGKMQWVQETKVWHKCFRNGWKSVESDPHPGRPATSRTLENVECVWALINKDQRLTVQEPEPDLGIPKTTVSKILTRILAWYVFWQNSFHGFCYQSRRNIMLQLLMTWFQQRILQSALNSGRYAGTTVWDPKVLTLKVTKASLSYAQCFLYFLSSINVCIFHIIWLYTFWTDLIYLCMTTLNDIIKQSGPCAYP